MSRSCTPARHLNVWVVCIVRLNQDINISRSCLRQVWDSAKINCCKFVLLEVVEASYFLWTSLDALALEVQL